MTKGPLRRVVDRRQDFNATDKYPAGYIVEALECGHDHIEPIESDIPDVIMDWQGRPALFPHRNQTERRRCELCPEVTEDDDRDESLDAIESTAEVG